MRVIISAGGTGGHIYPAIAIINKIKEEEPKEIYPKNYKLSKEKILYHINDI